VYDDQGKLVHDEDFSEDEPEHLEGIFNAYLLEDEVMD
jgi:hypothetical protein